MLRLNVYVAGDAATTGLDAALAARFGDAPPAVSLMYTPLVRGGAQVACDAVAAISRGGNAVEVVEGAAKMPAGGKVFVSGQAKRGPDFAASITQTMEGLHQAVAHVGLTKASVVHVKAFIAPFSTISKKKSLPMKDDARRSGTMPPPIALSPWQTLQNCT